jgi:PilZ domain
VLRFVPMFDPGDPRRDEIFELANLALSDRLRDGQRPRWRELVAQLLGNIRSEGGMAERRQHLRAPAELDVDILAPDEMISLATSTVGAGGLSIRIAEVIPAGTQMDLSIKVPQRKVPLLVQGQVIWSRPGELGLAFVDLYQSDRELLEGIAVKALLEDD